MTYTNGNTDRAIMVPEMDDPLTDDPEDDDDDCILTGKFKKEQILVSVTGCPGTQSFDVRFFANAQAHIFSMKIFIR